jgi:inhibitor of KinA sporulation pathway (predicted exonuclease)
MNYIIVDLEATCWEDISETATMEIIEIGAVFLHGPGFQPYSEFEQFVQPQINTDLSEFCKKLTGITQNHVDNAIKFPEAFEKFLNWIGEEPYKLCSWGMFDLDIFQVECARYKLAFSKNFAGHINLKELYARAYNTKPTIGLREAMQKRMLKFEGRLHRGIDDARNIAVVAQPILILDE